LRRQQLLKGWNGAQGGQFRVRHNLFRSRKALVQSKTKVVDGAIVHAGDVIVGDVDGLVVVPRQAAAEIAQLGTDRVAKEKNTRERLRSGELGLDFYGFRARLQELGVRYVDEEQ